MTPLCKILCLALMGAAALSPRHATAANVRIESGSVAFLKQESRVNLEYDFGEMKAGRNAKECVPEQEFIAGQVERRNKKKAGRGDSWKLEWIGQRSVRLQPRFQELLNRQFSEKKIPLEFGAFKEAKYTLVLKTKTIIIADLEGAGLSAPRISADALFVETNNRTNCLAVVAMTDMPGVVAAAGFEMREAYAKAAKELGLLLRRELFAR